MTYAPQPVTAVPPEVVWHVGRRPDPWAWVPWQYAGNQRWDDRMSKFRTVYAASTRFGCFVEVLAHFRPDPALADEMAAITVDEEDAELHPTFPAGEIDQDWVDKRAVSSAAMDGVFCDVTAAQTIATLRPFMLGLTRGLGLPDFDSATLKLGQPRALTQHVASRVYRLPSGVDDELFAGVRFASRHGDELEMWALFERPHDVPHSRRLTILTETAISAYDEELRDAMRLHGLAWPSSVAEGRIGLTQDLLFRDGWSRVTQADVLLVLVPLALDGATSEDQLHARLLERDSLGLDATAWEPLREYTDDELQALRAEFGNDEGDAESAAQANADEKHRRDRAVADMRRYAAALEVPEVHTLRDLLRFLIAARVVSEDTDGLSINPAAPLPPEVLPLSEDENRSQDELRWRRIHEGMAQRVIRLFKPDEAVRIPALVGSLSDYAETLQTDPESVRAALALLCSEGDFSADTDVDRVDTNQMFTLSVDWAKFSVTRISIGIAPRD